MLYVEKIYDTKMHGWVLAFNYINHITNKNYN